MHANSSKRHTKTKRSRRRKTIVTDRTGEEALRVFVRYSIIAEVVHESDVKLASPKEQEARKNTQEKNESN